jgi:branched-chain amino acid transport system ATP-binding protein
VTLLSVETLDVRHGLLRAVRDVSLEIRAGETLALVGANGAGKTTLLRAVAGAHRPAGGRIIFDGEDITAMPAHRRVRAGMALVPEGRRLFPDLTVEENLLVAGAAGRPGPWSVEAVIEAFPILRALRRRRALTLSGGEQHATAIGRALMTNPKLLLLDEVSLGLAPKVLNTIFERLQRVRDELGTAMLMVEQNAKLALEFCEHAFILESGRVVLDGPSAGVRENPKVQELYLGGSREGARRSFANAKRYRSRRRWL